MDTPTDQRPAGTVLRWLRGTRGDRARFDDMFTRLTASHLAGLTVGLTSVLVAWWTGPAVLATVVVAHLAMVVGTIAAHRLPDAREAVVGAVFVLLQVDLAAAVLLTGGAGSPLLPLVVVPVFTQAVCFRPRVLSAGMLLTAVLTSGAVLAAGALDPVPALPAGLHLVGVLALLLTLVAPSTWLADADLASRDDAQVDPLTGLYNRKALAARFADASAQAARRNGSLGLVVCDLDHFKAVNDTYGHDRGDLVLQEVADRLRAATRGDTPVYRMGGEEFLVLLPGAGPVEVLAVAERLRAAIAARPVAGLPVTVSAGASSGGGGLGLPELMKAADEALYAAKAAGRDCVRAAGLPSAAA